MAFSGTGSGRGGTCRVRRGVDRLAEHRVVDRGFAQVARHPRVRDGHHGQPRVLDLVLQGVGHDLRDPLGEPSRPRLVHHLRFLPSIFRAQHALSGREQLKLRPRGDEALAAVEHGHHVSVVSADAAHADQRSPVQVEMTRLGETFEPDPEASEVYDQLYRRIYLQMYAKLKPLYEEIREITGYPRQVAV